MAKRRGGTPEHEVEETARRMQKYPEHLRSASSSKEWFDFLDGIGVHEETTRSKAGKQFFEKVRAKIDVETYTGTRREQARDSKGRFTKGSTGRVITYVIYRSRTTKRIIDVKIAKIA